MNIVRFRPSVVEFERLKLEGLDTLGQDVVMNVNQTAGIVAQKSAMLKRKNS